MRQILFVTLCALAQLAWAQTSVTPTRQLTQSVAFEDDMDFKNMELVLTRQLEAFERSPLKGFIRFGKTTYPTVRLKQSAAAFLSLVKTTQACLVTTDRATCVAEMSAAINRDFDLYEPAPGVSEPGRGQSKTTLYTAYYSPDVVGSRTPSERFKNPIYRLPSTPEERALTREQIDFDHALAGKGLELFWVEDSLYDIYLLHVEGGGRIRVQNDDGTEEKIFLSYAGGNGQKFQFIYKYMVERGLLPASGAGIEAQRRYIENNPDKAREIFASCPSYVFYKETETEPLGVAGIPLTEGRSLAIDTTIYKQVGLITFVSAQKPRPDENGNAVFEPFSRFFVAQDTGGAIRGNARCDLYMGFGREAEFAANNTKTMGNQFFLVKKTP